MHGCHFLKQASTTQIPIALSSGESEWYAAVRSACALLGLQAMAKDFGVVKPARLHLDATAAKGIAARRGAGRVRHIDTQTLWLQRAVAEKRFVVVKVDGTKNPANLGTKHVDSKDMWNHLSDMGFYLAEGRSSLTLRADLRA